MDEDLLQDLVGIAVCSVLGGAVIGLLASILSLLA